MVLVARLQQRELVRPGGAAARAAEAVELGEHGLVALAAPRWGALLVAGWLGGIILNLLILGGYGDIAMRDAGLLAGALALNRLATAAHRR